jgi:general L-amino acid transport system substrate-binding protein
MKQFALAAALGLAALLSPPRAEAGPTVDAIKARGALVCGVRESAVGFAHQLADGKYAGIAVDICRAISIAILGDATKAKFVPLQADKRFPALKAGEVDILISGSTFTMTREVELGFEFPAVYLYDGQGIMLPRKLGKRSAKELNGVSICVTSGTTTERNLANYFRENKRTYKPMAMAKMEDLRAAFFGGKCDALSADATALYAMRAAYAPNPAEYVIVPELLSKEPLSLIVRRDDLQFSSIARWTFYAMVQAEEDGITSKNVDDKLKSEDPEIRRLLGVKPGQGKALGLDDDWVYKIVKQVGNYGESFERNVGMGSPLKIERGLNRLWSQGGLQYAPPIR